MSPAKSRGLGTTLVLVRRYQGGDATALNELFGRYAPRVERIVRLRMGPLLRRRLDVEDIVQQTFVVAFERFDDFELREPAGLVHWLSRIAENQLRDEADKARALKRDVRRERALESLRVAVETGGVHFDPSSDGPAPWAALERAEELAELAAGLQRLAPDHREVLLLRNIAGGSWHWVAEQLDRSEGAVQMLHARARAALASILRSAPEDGEG